jgi:hypothetical protein
MEFARGQPSLIAGSARHSLEHLQKHAPERLGGYAEFAFVHSLFLSTPQSGSTGPSTKAAVALDPSEPASGPAAETPTGRIEATVVR